jgi:hypothetical protein
MNTFQGISLPWLPGLLGQVEEGLQRLTAGKHDQRPALEQELKEIRANAQGWSVSLANLKLPLSVREVIEHDRAAALERQQAIEADLSELAQDGLRAEQLARPEQLVARLDRLGDVLFNRTNLKERRRRELGAMKNQDLQTARPWALKVHFRHFWNYTLPDKRYSAAG